MTLMTILAASDNGNYFDGVARACNMSAGEARSAVERLVSRHCYEAKIKNAK